jgi:hypothetical protein
MADKTAEDDGPPDGVLISTLDSPGRSAPAEPGALPDGPVLNTFFSSIISFLPHNKRLTLSVLKVGPE